MWFLILGINYAERGDDDAAGGKQVVSPQTSKYTISRDGAAELRLMRGLFVAWPPDSVISVFSTLSFIVCMSSMLLLFS